MCARPIGLATAAVRCLGVITACDAHRGGPVQPSPAVPCQAAPGRAKPSQAEPSHIHIFLKTIPFKLQPDGREEQREAEDEAEP